MRVPWSLKRIGSLPEVIHEKTKMLYRAATMPWPWRVMRRMMMRRMTQKKNVQASRSKTKMTMTVTFD